MDREELAQKIYFLASKTDKMLKEHTNYYRRKEVEDGKDD
jgi:hypothetical protein|tara:strand:+ start:138 stop:257 length:120 start_codon:yes stop_codon:yes gene_type:complete